VTTTTNEIVGGLYVFENGTSPSTPTDDVTTCIVLGFEKGGIVYYYRANINVTAVGQRLQRNNVYRVTVKNILGEGESCELDAYTKGEFLLDVAVNEWNVDDQGSILSDGENVLAVPTNHIVFTSAAESRSYSIYTAGPGVLELSRSLLPAGITASLEGNTLTVAVTANEEEREGYIELHAGNLKAVVSIKQTGNLDKYIILSRYSVPSFPGNGIFQMEGDVQVVSSGPWSARIYGAGFTFQFRGTAAESPVEMLHYPPGESFSITSLTTNPGLTPRYAFVSIYLDEAPDVNQVLALSQEGQTTYQFDNPLVFPADALAFNAIGTKTGGRDRYVVEVGGLGDGEWKVIVPDTHADRFHVRYYNASGVLQPAATSFFGNGSFELVAALNKTSSEFSTSVDVVLLDNMTGSKQTIPVTQGKFAFSLTNTPVGSIPAMGGTMATAVGVQLDPAWADGEWSAEVTASTGNAAYFGTPGTTTATGNLTDGITLAYAKLPFPYARQGATTTVTVSLAGTYISETFTVPQDVAPWRALNVQSATNSYGSLGPAQLHISYFKHFYDLIHDVSAVGTNGSLVQTASALNFSINPTPDGQIFNANLGGGYIDTPGKRTAVDTWLNAHPANFLIVAGDDAVSYADRKALLDLVLGTSCYTAADAEKRRVAPRPGGEGPNGRLWDYMMTGVDTSKLEFNSDGASGYLEPNRPSTTVALLQSAGGCADLAIDPTKRLLFIGSVDFFGTIQNNPLDPSEQQFLKNLIAFMVNAAQYGEYFLSDFK
jgi:hypothetical protein